MASRIPEAPLHRLGYWQVRPGDVVGRSDLILVDVRPEADLLGDLGHIHGVRRVDAAAARDRGLPDVPRDAPVVVVCANGHASRDVAAALAQVHGYREVFHLVGGMVRWCAEERPVARVPTWR